MILYTYCCKLLFLPLFLFVSILTCRMPRQMKTRCFFTVMSIGKSRGGKIEARHREKRKACQDELKRIH